MLILVHGFLFSNVNQVPVSLIAYIPIDITRFRPDTYSKPAYLNLAYSEYGFKQVIYSNVTYKQVIHSNRFNHNAKLGMKPP